MSAFGNNSALKKRKRVSKKNKSAWRKHSDVNDVEAFLEQQRREERRGGLVAEKQNEELFFVDSKCAENSEKNIRVKSLKDKPLRCHRALLPDENVKPIRISANRGHKAKICKEKVEKAAAGILSKKEKLAIAQREAAKKKRAQLRASRQCRGIVNYDLWGQDEKNDKEIQDDHYLTTCKLKRLPRRPYQDKRPSEVPAIEIVDPGASYNPSFEDHQKLLSDALVIEEKKMKEEMRLVKTLEGQFPTADEAPNEATWLQEMSAGLMGENESDSESEITGEELSRISVNPAVRRENKKTEKERKKDKERKLLTKQQTKKKLDNLKKQELFRLKSIKRELRGTEQLLALRAAKAEMKKQADRLRTKKLGKLKFAEPTKKLKLSEELEGSLRLLKPEGHVLEDRFKSLQKRNIIEPRLRAKRVRKYKPKEFEKKGHKSLSDS